MCPQLVVPSEVGGLTVRVFFAVFSRPAGHIRAYLTFHILTFTLNSRVDLPILFLD